MSEGWLTVKTAAEALGLSASTVYDLVAAGELACYRIGLNRGRIRFRPSDLDAYLEKSRVGPKAKVAPAPTRPRYVPKDDLRKPYRSR